MKKVSLHTFLFFILSTIVVLLFAAVFNDRTGVLSVGLVIILLLSTVISLLMKIANKLD